MKASFDFAIRLAIPCGILLALAARYFGIMSPARLEVLYGAFLLMALCALVLIVQIKKRKKVVGFDISGQPYESEGYDLASAPKAMRRTIQGFLGACYVLFWWVLTEFALGYFVR